ncbi:MAG: ABC transporter ATP-binding protein [Candidatus Glassbacteria bacterium]|nr:ABC transporter ATP-binding protein [Candidatus Glassbacteria bacterium]
MASESNINGDVLLAVRGLKTYFFTPESVVKAVDGVSFEVHRGEILGLVGESGSGKSVTALSVLGLLPSPPARIVDGRILYRGADLVKLPPAKMRAIRGRRISMIFQEPMTSLNPVYTLGSQIAEVYTEHFGMPHSQALTKAVEILRRMGIPSPELRAHDYPVNMSGGMCQRAMIAIALAGGPELIIADEPTTALDVTIQAQILDQLRDLCRADGTSVLLITHNLGVVAEYAERVLVMYAGRIVEEAPVDELFERPLHPYTAGLLNSIPKLGGKSRNGKQRLSEIPGMVPSLDNLPSGCSFHPRCPLTSDKCREHEPELTARGPARRTACWAVCENRDGTG